VKRHKTVGLLGVLVAIALPLTWWSRQPLYQQAKPAIAVFPAMPTLPTDDFPNPAPFTLSAADESAIATVIRQQIAAFQADDAELAFSLASPTVQQRFPTAAHFMAMVRADYEPVYRPQSLMFEEIGWIRGKPIQAVTVLGPAGEWMTAYYQMEQQPDQTWRIAGCLLVPIGGETI
jgi:hypothetical protein